MTASIVNRFTALAPRILGVQRIIVGAMFACYGAMKLFGVFGGLPPGVPKILIWTAGPIEFLGGILIAIGLFSRITSFICSGQMAFAYFIGHAPHGFFPIVNKGELALLFCWMFLYYAAAGPGAFAVDNLLGRVRTRNAST
jgi:putative oxidoreductase